MINQIETEVQYLQIKAEMEALLQKATQSGGFASLTEQEDQELLRLSHMVKAYEDIHHPMPTQPTTLDGMIKLKMFEMNLRQKDLAVLLDIEAPRVSDLLRGKRKVSLSAARQLYKKLGIPAEFILENG